MIKELEKNPKHEDIVEDSLDEHQFLVNCFTCLKLTRADLEYFQYVDVAKMLLCYSRQFKDKKKTKKASQSDWDRLSV